MRKYRVIDTFTVVMVKNERPASYTKGAIMTFTHAEIGKNYFLDPFRDECYTKDNLSWLEDVGAISRMGNYVRGDRKHGVAKGQPNRFSK